MTTATELIVAGQRCNASGDLERAENLFRQAVEADASNADSFFELGVTCYRLNKRGEAADSFQAALRLDPQHAEAHNYLGMTWQSLNNLEAAIDCYRKACELNPKFGDAQFNLGQAYLAKRNPVAAEHCFRHCLSLQPDLFDAHCRLGKTVLAQGRADEAVECYMQALQQRPKSVDLYVEIAQIMVKQGKLEPAVVAFRQAVRLQPEVPELHFNLGNLLRKQNKIEEAEAHLKHALALQPSFTQASLNLGVMLAENKREAEAIPLFKLTLQHDPNNVQAHSNLGTALAEEGERDEAANHFREALRLDPHNVPAFSTSAIHDLLPLTDADIGRMKGLLAEGKVPRFERSLLCCALGDLQKRSGNYDLAFEYYRQGNRLRRQLWVQQKNAFSAEQQRALVDRLAQTFDEAYFKRVRPFGLETNVPVFIVGMPRSGTSLVEQILSAHPLVFGAGELSDIATIADRLPAQLGTSDHYPECAKQLTRGKIRAAARQHLDRLLELGGAADRVTDKMPNNFLHLGLILTLFPRAKIIHCRRNPLDTCLSCYMQWFRGLNFTWDLDDLAQYYRQYVRVMDHWRTVLPTDILEVDYEKVTEDQEAESRRLVEFCGLEWDQRCLNFYENRRAVHTMSTMQVRKPIYKSSVGRWRRYEKHLQPLIDALGDLVEN